MTTSGTSPTDEDGAKLEREGALWDALREEHFETIEQLPLTLYRQLALLRELDQQSETFRADVVPTLHSYLFRRANLAKKSASSSNARVQVQDHTTSNLGHGNRPTWEILGQLAHLSENVLRISEEKVNLAIAAHDSVERHIRLLDQAIHEQQLILSSSTTGSLATPIILPDLSVPRWARSSRSTCNLSEDEALAEIEPILEGPSKPKDSGPSDRSKVPGPRRPSRKLDASQDVLSQSALATDDADSQEQRYCYCNRVSFGQMIACDDGRCRREWFHLECTNFTVPPEGKWYCEDCTARKRKRK
ncbi:hypothetical protein BDN72DRAFT_842468 [Pluteus cervinus]|uniref:Uncharacterized protein n=1 Tax=Pluteus cervinus TaxID=181527 RepID=A0ACD3AQS2_9AGAR|nr:hypothetical protein BDN72DRAFT_842468 [Pluteus cervinus]